MIAITTYNNNTMYDVKEHTNTAVGSADLRNLVALSADKGDYALDDLKMKVPLTTRPTRSCSSSESFPHCEQWEAVGCK
jgi:hypothetical protein